MKAEHIVILGGTGFVGRRLASALVADGRRVTVLSRNRAIERDVQVLPGVEVLDCDVYDQAAFGASDRRIQSSQ